MNENVTEKILTYDNFNGTKKLSIILFLANFILLFMDYINRVNGMGIINDGYNYLFYSHVVLGLVTLLYILVFYRIKVHSANDITLSHKSYVAFFAFFILSISAVISGWIDQKIHGQITVYVIICITTAVVYNYKPKVTALLYGLPWVAFIIFVTISQKDPNIRQGHYLNASLLVVISYFLSTLLYKLKQQDLMHKYYLDDLVTERTKELQMTNDLLTKEIIERKKNEIEMARLERLNLIGQMAAGIAHEIRNPMTTVRGYLQLLGAKAEFQSHDSTFELMIKELDRANLIITEFLSLSKNSPTEGQCQNINEILRHLYPLLEADTFTQNKEIVFEAGETPDIFLNAKEISQLVLNLCRNGLEAMQVGGTLTMRTYIEDEHVVFSVEDEGCGIHSESLDKVGTPFFTTKDNGTGLGLAICLNIADRHNATINLKSGSGGTTFFVRFPCLEVNPIAPLLNFQRASGAIDLHNIWIKE